MHSSPDLPCASHRICAQRYFEDFEIGERFILPSRTMTDALFAAFQLASGDNHPVHYDIEYCRAHGMPNMLAHGFQVAIQTAAGAGLFPQNAGYNPTGTLAALAYMSAEAIKTNFVKAPGPLVPA